MTNTQNPTILSQQSGVRLVADDDGQHLYVFTDARCHVLDYQMDFGPGTPSNIVDAARCEAERLNDGWVR